MTATTLQSAVSDVMAAAGFSSEYRLHQLMGGANNQVFRVDVDGMNALLKVYFHHPDDRRDRLRAEFSFSTFAWERGVRWLPRPLASDPQNRLGLYEFIPGRPVASHEVTRDLVRQALHFYLEINRHTRHRSAQALPSASEACFSIADHLRCVERRLETLLAVEDASAVHREAMAFIRGELSEAWGDVLTLVRQRIRDAGLTIQEDLPIEDRCISPSDFGFHNALWRDATEVAFIDFEYAGWDDPAKMVCDFFCQPAVPVSLEHLDLATHTMASELADPTPFLHRVAWLMPVCRLKWCCILLNEFVPVGTARRRFAGGTEEADRRKAQQLQKARALLHGALSEWTVPS